MSKGPPVIPPEVALIRAMVRTLGGHTQRRAELVPEDAPDMIAAIDDMRDELDAVRFQLERHLPRRFHVEG